MKHFIYFSSSAATSGKSLSKGQDLMKAGRMDIVIHTIISAFFLSHDMRKDVKMHLVFYGMPDPPKHIEISIKEGLEISKKDVATLIKKILYKFREGEKKEVFPGCFIERKSLYDVIEEVNEEVDEVFILDKKGENLREIDIPEKCAFVLGDHEGLPKKEAKRLKKTLTGISVGPKVYFASQTVAIVNNELDIRGI